MSELSFGYYGADPYADDDGEQYEEPVPQRGGAKTPGLRNFIKSQQAENQRLRQQVEKQEQMLKELIGDDSPASQAALTPMSTVAPDGQAAMNMFQNMGLNAAPPAGSDVEMARAVAACKSQKELDDLLVGQGNTMVGYSYDGMGY